MDLDGAAVWWILFNIFILICLAFDLGLHRKAHEISTREALIWSGVWIALALVFNVLLYFWRGHDAALAFLTGYLIERALSIDNIFVFYLIFSYFAVPPAYQHKVLFWGVFGAFVMRAAMILLGVVLIRQFHWVVYVFGVLLIVTGARMAISHETEVHPERNPVLRLVRRVVPMSHDYVEDHLFARIATRYVATPLFIVLVVVETTDLAFAIDSIPAILAITRDPFIVYTSNVFAILGLRALYFALAGVIPMFQYLHYGLAAILVFVGAKMVISDFYDISVGVSLAVVGVILAVSVVASVLSSRREAEG
jgi:tellurite resistance protein TerC